MERQLLRGYFLDYFYDCPYEMHDLTSKEYLSQIIKGLKEEHKEIFYFLFLRQFSPQYLALLRGQTDRNIRKVRDTVLRKIRKKMNKQLLKMAEDGHRLGGREMQFLFNYRMNGEMKEEEFFLAAIGNGRCCGGGFCSAPDAAVNDGEMDVLLIRPVHGLKMLQMLLKYRKGTHMTDRDADKYIIFKRTDHFKLYPAEPVNVSVDGEVSTFEGSEFSMVKGAVNIVIPKGSELLSESERVALG